MEPDRGEYRYGGDCVMVGKGIYRKRIAKGKLSRSSRAPIFMREVTELVRVIPFSNLYNYVELGWEEAHRRACEEANSWSRLK